MNTKTTTENEKLSRPLSIESLLDALIDEEKEINRKAKNIRGSRIEKLRKFIVERESGQRNARLRKNAASLRNDRLRQGKKAFSAVLDHPQFQQDSLATINEHLLNTIRSQSIQEKK